MSTEFEIQETFCNTCSNSDQASCSNEPQHSDTATYYKAATHEQYESIAETRYEQLVAEYDALQSNTLENSPNLLTTNDNIGVSLENSNVQDIPSNLLCTAQSQDTQNPANTSQEHDVTSPNQLYTTHNHDVTPPNPLYTTQNHDATRLNPLYTVQNHDVTPPNQLYTTQNHDVAPPNPLYTTQNHDISPPNLLHTVQDHEAIPPLPRPRPPKGLADSNSTHIYLEPIKHTPMVIRYCNKLSELAYFTKFL
jgi:hypothetical protein